MTRAAPPILAVLTMLALAVPAAARSKIGIYHDWGAFQEDAPQRCFAIAEPVRHTADKAFASVSTWPERGLRNQIAVHLSRTVGDRPVTLSIGERQFTLIARGAAAWAPDARADRAIVAAMRSGRSMSVEGVSASGRPFADVYALAGAATAIDAAALACVPR
ncbi:MAG: hypothetical protein ACTHMG_13305 [Sphingomonas sp.]